MHSTATCDQVYPTEQRLLFFLRHKKKEEDKQTDAGFVTPKGARRPQSALACGGNFLPWLSFCDTVALLFSHTMWFGEQVFSLKTCEAAECVG